VNNHSPAQKATLILAALLPLAAWFAGAQTPNASPAPAPRAPAFEKNSSVPVIFNGVTKFRENQLRDALSDQIGEIRESGLNPASADDTAFFLTLFYHKQGYSQADVKWKIDSNRLVLTVSEGPYTIVQEVIFTGNQAMPSNTLRDYLLGGTRERLPMFKRELPCIGADIKTGTELIHALYQSEGYLDSIVDEPEITYSADKTRAIIRINIREGMQYRFGKLSFTGDLVFYPQTDLLKELDPFLTKPYTQAEVTDMQRKVVYFYRSRGYFGVKVDAKSDPSTVKDGRVPVEFDVQSGTVYRFGGVKVTGLDRLNASFLPKRFAKLRGKFYNPSRLDDIYREMMRTGIFKSLKITSVPLPSNEVELDMEVEEAKSKEIGISGGYGSFEGPILGLRVGDRDLFGNGRPVSATFEFSERLLKGELLYTDPWFLETPNSLKLRAYALNQDWQGYTKFEYGGRAELSRKLTTKLEASVFLLTRNVHVTDTGLDVSDLGPVNYTVNSLGTALILDLRDKPSNALNPGKGLKLQATGEFASTGLGSSISFLRGTITASYYVPIKSTLLSFGARGGFISPLNSEIPVDERFFNGGAQTVRSFVERELGPKDGGGNPVGGETFTVFNTEYNFPLFGDLGGAVFVDAGSVGQQVSNGIGQMRYGIGTGLRYRLPIGPLRLDYGFNPSPKDGEAFGAVQFSFGFTF
jgi:outer membrane protein assembly complex protein YaeT